MRNCSRRFLVKLTRVVNSVVTLYGAGMIVYCLWLSRKWKEGAIGLPFSQFLAHPLFINIFLAVGIALCLATISGYIVSNCFSNFILGIYLVSVCCLLLLEVAVIDIIFFKMDWLLEINKYIDENHGEFKSFVIFHLRMCRLIMAISLVPQASAIALVMILWAVGIESISGYHLNVPDFRQSFLVLPISVARDDSV
ncbi:hypothetical protein L6164_024148 [Bauhinia variegata]|uniref:Uncharacterized protein n=1 Tax=Bauhinia variegata TaxID=167791 RepID=A0ACB9LZ03_BAUVA|nr:hypothetical protein L6164_024148 [Bauhinia variegata]